MYDSYTSLKHLIMGYRAGYSANERREIESNLFHGYLKGVVSTTALELGIDIGSISTKGVVIDEDNKIISSLYIWTEGSPINSVKRLVNELKSKIPKGYVVRGIGGVYLLG